MVSKNQTSAGAGNNLAIESLQVWEGKSGVTYVHLDNYVNSETLVSEP